MSSNPNSNTKPPLGKKPQLTEKQLKPIRMVLQKVDIFQPVVGTYFYNIMTKQSGTGIFSNQRMFILHVEQRCLKYLSKIPQGYLPFETVQQLQANKQKQKVVMAQASNFKCFPTKGKISSLTIQWEDKDKKKYTWNLTLASSKLMNDWNKLINEVYNNTFAKEKYDAMSAVKSNIQPTNSMPQNNFQNSHAIQQENLNTSQNNMPVNNANSQNSLQNNPSLGNTNNYLNRPKQSNDNTNHYLKANNPNLPVQNAQKNHYLKEPEKLVNSNSNIAQSSKQVKLGPKMQQNVTKNSDLGSAGYKPYIPKINQMEKPSDKDIDSRLRQSESRNIDNSRNSGINAQNKYTSSVYMDENGNSKVGSNQNINNSKNNIIPSNLPSQIQSPANYHPGTVNQQGESSVKHNPSMQASRHSHKVQSPYLKGSIPQNNNNQSLLNRDQSKKPTDFVEELKYMKEKKSNKFNMTNELSKKKFDTYQQNEGPPNLEGSRDNYNFANTHSNFVKQPHDSRQYEVQQHYQSNRKLVPGVSQKFLNKSNSGDKRQINYSPPKDKVLQPEHYNVQERGRAQTNYDQFSNREYERVQDRQNHYKSRGQLPSHQNRQSSSGLQNNYDQFSVNQFGDNYRPSTNFPDSARNLKNIRSGYLQKRSQIIVQEDYKQDYPMTVNNQSRMLGDTYKNQLSRQKSRQQSLNNLNKVNSEFIPRNIGTKANSKHVWNQIWLQTSNPNKKIQVHEQFVQKCEEIVKTIVQQLPFPKSYRQYQPYEVKENYHTYLIQNIQITLHIFENAESINGQEDNIHGDAHVLYDQSSYQELKRQFYNYNLILGVTSNQGFIKVPLCTYLEYRGILALCKAQIPQSYEQIEPYSYKDQFDALENIIKVRFLFGTYNIFESNASHRGDGKFIVLYNLRNLIPGIPNSLHEESSYFRKQFLLQYDQILEDLQSSSEAHNYTLRHLVSDLITKLQSLQVQILHTKDLRRQFHKVGLSVSYIPEVIEQTKSVYLKKIFKSEIVSNIFTDVVRSELNHVFTIMPAQNLQSLGSEQLNKIILDCIHVLIEDLFSYTRGTQTMWKMIVQESMKRFKVFVSKQDTIPGYLLAAVVAKCGLIVDFKDPAFDKNKQFYITQNTVPRQCILKFDASIRRYDMEAVCPTYSKCKQILEEEPSVEAFENLVMILNLKNKMSLPDYYERIRQQLKTYICGFIPYGEEQQYENIDAYQYLYEQPLTYNGMKASLLAIKWLIKNRDKKDIQQANQILQIKYHESSFWIGEENSSIIQFYDFFSMYYASIGNYPESISLAKNSLQNVQKLLGFNALPAADKHYQLGNIFFKIGRKENSLSQFEKTKDILLNHQQTSIPQFGIILLKIALIYLNFGKISECVANALQAQKIFQQNQGNQNEEIQCFQILARAYEITRKTHDISKMNQVCARIFNNTQDPKILRRMLKIVIYPRLSQLSTQQQKSLTQILFKLQQQAFTYLHKKAENHNLKKKIYQYLQNIVLLIDQVNRRDLLRKHVSLSIQAVAEAQQMLVMFQAVGIIIGFNFLIGSMKDTYYQ